MNSLRLAALFLVCFTLTGASLLHAKDKDKVRVVLVSKVEAAKGRMREKTATEWMTVAELEKLNDTKKAEKQQLIYFEYHGGRDKWRGIYTDKVMLVGWSWWTFNGEHEMEAKVNEQMDKGLMPAFIGRSGNWYSMLFVTPQDLPAARKVLDELGVGEPKLKR